MRRFTFVVLFVSAHLAAHLVAQVQAQVPSQDDRLVSFSYNQGSTFQYTPDLPDYEEDTIFAPNSVNPPLGGPTPALRFLGKGAGSEIETDAISYGYKHHPRHVNLLSAFFSVSPQSTGVVGSAVNNEGFDDRGSDIFASELTGSNRQVYDGNGLLMQPGAKKIGLMEAGSAHIDALDMRAEGPQFLGIEPLPEAALYWSIAERNGWTGAEPQAEYSMPGYTGSDIFYGLPVNGYANNPAGIDRYAEGIDLGLLTGDDVDALVVVDLDGNRDDFDPLVDAIFYSLSNESTSLTLAGFAGGAVGKTGGDVFQVGFGAVAPSRFAKALDFGLNPANDDLVALDFAVASMVDGYISTVPEPCTLLYMIVGCSLLARRGRSRY
ncbi:MAG: hypothetical protein P8M53_04000 [Pirellulales bacterium]|nr:hypothetical protein [Pirellulales bacterium]